MEHIKLTDAERELDIAKMLADTEAAIEFLKKEGQEVPAEATEMRTIMRRVLAAEQRLASAPDNDVFYGAIRLIEAFAPADPFVTGIQSKLGDHRVALHGPHFNISSVTPNELARIEWLAIERR